MEKAEKGGSIREEVKENPGKEPERSRKRQREAKEVKDGHPSTPTIALGCSEEVIMYPKASWTATPPSQPTEEVRVADTAKKAKGVVALIISVRVKISRIDGSQIHRRSKESKKRVTQRKRKEENLWSDLNIIQDFFFKKSKA